MAIASNVIQLRQQRKKRRPLTPQQRNILQAERSGTRAVRAKYQARTESEKEVLAARYSAETAAYRDVESARTKGYYKRHVGTKVIDASVKNPIVNPIILIFGVMALLIIFYMVVTSADAFSGFLGSTQTGLRKLSTTSPLFERNS